MQSSAGKLPFLIEDSPAGSGANYESTSFTSGLSIPDMPTMFDTNSGTHFDMTSWQTSQQQLEMLPYAEAAYDGAAPVVDLPALSAVNDASDSTGGDGLRSLEGSNLPNMLSLPTDYLPCTEYQNVLQNTSHQLLTDNAVRIQWWPKGGHLQLGAGQLHHDLGRKDNQIFAYGYPGLYKPSVDDFDVLESRSGTRAIYHGL